MPTTLEEYLALVRSAFQADRARGAHAVLQYVFSGDVVGECYFVVEDGTLETAIGRHPAPTVTVAADFAFWQRVLAYEEDALMAYQAGKYQVTGNFDAVLDAYGWFGQNL